MVRPRHVVRPRNRPRDSPTLCGHTAHTTRHTSLPLAPTHAQQRYTPSFAAKRPGFTLVFSRSHSRTHTHKAHACLERESLTSTHGLVRSRWTSRGSRRHHVACGWWCGRAPTPLALATASCPSPRPCTATTTGAACGMPMPRYSAAAAHCLQWPRTPLWTSLLD